MFKLLGERNWHYVSFLDFFVGLFYFTSSAFLPSFVLDSMFSLKAKLKERQN
jgi:hypothetical protein